MSLQQGPGSEQPAEQTTSSSSTPAATPAVPSSSSSSSDQSATPSDQSAKPSSSSSERNWVGRSWDYTREKAANGWDRTKRWSGIIARNRGTYVAGGATTLFLLEQLGDAAVSFDPATMAIKALVGASISNTGFDVVTGTYDYFHNRSVQKAAEKAAAEAEAKAKAEAEAQAKLDAENKAKADKEARKAEKARLAKEALEQTIAELRQNMQPKPAADQVPSSSSSTTEQQLEITSGETSSSSSCVDDVEAPAPTMTHGRNAKRGVTQKTPAAKKPAAEKPAAEKPAATKRTRRG